MDHQNKINQIAKQLRKASGPVTFVRHGVSHKVPNAHQNEETNKIHLPKLDKIIEIDPKNLTCTAESGVPFCNLVLETLKYNLVPYTVPELKTITIGGAVSGCSVESMSYKHGGFHDSCLEYEIVTSDGKIINCSNENQSEIFHMLHGTFGTLGIITKIKFKLHPAKPYVKLNYVKYDNFSDYAATINQHFQKQDLTFMDGIIHNPTHYTLCIGTFVDDAPYLSNYEGQKIYYKSTKTLEEDYMTTYDYFFRYDTECHWISRNYGLENPLLRRFFGKFFLSSTNMIKTAKKLKFIFKNFKPEVVVDIFIPFSKFKDFFNFYRDKFNYYPLWIVPYKIAKPYPWINPKFMEGVEDQLFIDCAIYGMRQKGNTDYYRLLDEKLIELQGIKTLISHNNYSKDAFWHIYDRQNYNRIKQTTDPKGIFKDLYEKMH